MCDGSNQCEHQIHPLIPVIFVVVSRMVLEAVSGSMWDVVDRSDARVDWLIAPE